MTTAVASARKSLGEYKPLIVYASGKTEVCEQSAERAGQHTRDGFKYHGNRMARGTTYTDRDAAIAAAQAVIDARRTEAVQRLAKFEATAPAHLREKLCDHVRREIETWGGTPTATQVAAD